MPRYITEIVRLRPAPVAEFNRIISAMEESRPFNARFYEATHKCLRNYHASGNIDILRASIRSLEAEAERSCGRDRIEPTANAEVLACYLDHFALPFRKVAPGVPPRFKSFTLPIGSLSIKGKPHLALTSRNGATKFTYFVTSKEWTESDVRFAANLLSEIVVTNIPGTSHADIELLDCRRGRHVIGHPLSKRDKDALVEIGQILELRGLN